MMPRTAGCRRPATPLLVVPLLYSLVAFLFYLVLARRVRQQPESALDLAVTLRVQRLDHPLLGKLMSWVSWPGFRPQSLILPGLVVGSLWVTRRRLESLLLLVAWMASMGSFLTKLVIRRPRPRHPLIRVTLAKLRDTSYPSGHTLHYTAFWGMAAYLAARATPWRPLRRLIAGAAAVLIALVGPSRIYLGHHWLTDVLGSYLLGSSWLVGLISLHRWLRGRQSSAEQVPPATKSERARPAVLVGRFW
ncbi:phosphatase PAP2 family protein [Thermomicrobiaceae bacterium CFH 74404]|uniref:Phosphatase PAP2 family protein n=1 Tax=Thermalbibacter longus TaxID=2951981 RepID=A0AA41WCG9_9BACT|nr:phosphatase PAP2 family protein [Thermalbibacter longus]MCM8747745.1 phosphatase PAP2 family protein [Thermalbibacter longus]